jgi:hypothetical protein
MIDGTTAGTLIVLVFWFMVTIYYWHWYKRSLKK